MVVMPKSDAEMLKALAFPQKEVAWLTSVDIPLAGGTIADKTIIVEVGDSIEIATDVALTVRLSSGSIIKQNCAGMYAYKLSVYRALRAKAYPDKGDTQ